MPTYEYRCRECDETIEVVQSFTDDALTECPACKGRLKKVFSPVGIAFRGDGFYKNDSRGGSSKSADSSSEKESVSSSSGSDSSSKDSSSDSKSSPNGSGSDKKKSSSDSSSPSSDKAAKSSASSS